MGDSREKVSHRFNLITIPIKRIAEILKVIFELVLARMTQTNSKYCNMLDSIKIMPTKTRILKTFFSFNMLDLKARGKKEGSNLFNSMAAAQ